MTWWERGPVCAVRLCVFLHDSWMDFLDIGYHDQVVYAADVFKTEVGSVTDLSNYDKFFQYIQSICCDISETSVMIIFIFGTLIRYNPLLMLLKCNLVLCDIWVIMAILSLILCICCSIVERNGSILFIFGTVINQNGDWMHVKYILALCQNLAFTRMSIIS